MNKLRIVPERSSIRIEARSTLHPIHGNATGPQGEAEVVLRDGGFDLSRPPRARLELPVERLNSGNALQDFEMQRRIEARRYPSVTAELRGVEPDGQPGRYRLTADLTFHGVTRRLELTVGAMMAADATVVVEGSFELDVRGFDVNPPRFLGMQVHPEVKVQVRLELREADPPPA